MSTASELLAAVRELVPAIAEGAADRDRERRLPREQLDALSRVGALAITVPTSHGGVGGGASAAARRRPSS